MTLPRQSRWFRSAVFGRGASPSMAAAALGAALLLPGAEAAIPHSRARHPLPTALHTATLSQTSSQAEGKHRKGAAKGKAGAHAAGARSSSTGSRGNGKRGKKRNQRDEPADPPIPMYHARRGAAAVEHGENSSAHLLHHGRHPGSGYGPAPLVSSYHREHREARHTFELASNRPSLAEMHPFRPATPAPRPAPIVRRTPAAPNDTPANSPTSSAGSTAPRSEVFAEGVSHPDDDERLPRDGAVLGEDAPTTLPAAAARVSAAAPKAPVTTQAQPAVVQGFGGEIAVPSGAASERPGGTHRRNHPSNWQPESVVTPPEPLEEREAITYAAVSPAVLPEIYDRNGRLQMPAPLKGSHDVLVHQNVMASNDGLTRIQDDADLDRMRSSHLLVSFPVSESLRMNEDLPYNRRVARPWSVAFATDLGHAFYQRFRQPLQVNSAVRTVHYQAHLLMVNGNAAGLSGDTASPHLTGQAIDLAKRGMSQAELAWMRGYLLPLMQAGKIDVEEEFQQACFHVSVYRSYTAGRHATREYAQVHALHSEAAQAGSGDDR